MGDRHPAQRISYPEKRFSLHQRRNSDRIIPENKKIIPDPELPPEQCQHIRILDVDKPVQRVFYECYHCLQGLLSECSGKPVIEEFKGKPSVRELKVKCPNCGETAIKLTTEKVLSTTAIDSPWAAVESV